MTGHLLTFLSRLIQGIILFIPRLF